MSNISADNTARLTEMLERENSLLGRILELTLKQAELIASDSDEELTESLGVRKTLLKEVNGLRQESDLLMQSCFSKPGAKDRAAAAADAKRKEILGKCAAQNTKNIASAKAKIGEYSGKISELERDRKGLGAYIHPVGNESEFFDRMT